MFNIFIWRYSAVLLDTYSDYDLAETVLAEMKELAPDRKMWIEPVVCRNSIYYTLEKFKKELER